MSTPTYIPLRLMTKFVFTSSITTLGQTYKIRLTPLEAGPVQFKNAMGSRLGNCRDPLPGDQRQKASTQGV
jgi:hypothetical protein